MIYSLINDILIETFQYFINIYSLISRINLIEPLSQEVNEAKVIRITILNLCKKK